MLKTLLSIMIEITQQQNLQIKVLNSYVHDQYQQQGYEGKKPYFIKV